MMMMMMMSTHQRPLEPDLRQLQRRREEREEQEEEEAEEAPARVVVGVIRLSHSVLEVWARRRDSFC